MNTVGTKLDGKKSFAVIAATLSLFLVFSLLFTACGKAPTSDASNNLSTFTNTGTSTGTGTGTHTGTGTGTGTHTGTGTGTGISVPSAPTGVSATAGNGQATVSWTALTGATSYNVYYSTSSGITKSTGTKVSGATSGQAITGLTNGTKYYFIVTAVNAGGEGPASLLVNPMSVTRKVPDTGQTGNYTTTHGEDSDYTVNPSSYTDNGNGTITDNVTGLMWQKRDDGTVKKETVATTYCGGLALGGYSDWRLPSLKELEGIVDYGTYTPTINSSYFPDTMPSPYWSGDQGNLWDNWAFYYGIDFSDGTLSSKNNPYYVRCVRGVQQGENYTKGDGIITDNVSGLMWPIGSDYSSRNWEEAINYCEGLTLGGYVDWRLPSIKEATSIRAARGGFIPNVDTFYFDGGNGTTVQNSNWSSTTVGSDASNAYVTASVNSGGVESKTGSAFTWCVRLGSNSTNATPQASTTPPIPAPTGVLAVANSLHTTISWTAVAGATSYNIYYRTTAGVTAANGTKVAGATSPQTITGLTNGIMYYFVVTAVNADGESGGSNEASAIQLSIADLVGNWSAGSNIAFTVTANGSLTNFTSRFSINGSCFGGLAAPSATYSGVTINTTDFSISASYSDSSYAVSSSSSISGTFTSASTMEGSWDASMWNVCTDSGSGTFTATKQ